MNVYTQAMPEGKRAAKQYGGAEGIAVRDLLRNRVARQSRSMLDNVPPMIIC